VTAIERPKFVTVPLADGLKWRGGGGWHFEEKMDGEFSIDEIECATIVGEQMRDGRFFAFDITHCKGYDLRPLPLKERLCTLSDVLASLQIPASSIVRPAHSANGGEFLEAVLARGGEGVVAKLLDAPYGQPWHKCKRVQTFDLVVTDKAAPSIRLATVQGEDRGWCCARAAFEQITIGDIVEVAAYALTGKGKLREPRFVRIRKDKMAE
jgi:ATP-dependent DNA ligase